MAVTVLALCYQEYVCDGACPVLSGTSHRRSMAVTVLALCCQTEYGCDGACPVLSGTSVDGMSVTVLALCYQEHPIDGVCL